MRDIDEIDAHTDSGLTSLRSDAQGDHLCRKVPVRNELLEVVGERLAAHVDAAHRPRQRPAIAQGRRMREGEACVETPHLSRHLGKLANCLTPLGTRTLITRVNSTN